MLHLSLNKFTSLQSLIHFILSFLGTHHAHCSNVIPETDVMEPKAPRNTVEEEDELGTIEEIISKFHRNYTLLDSILPVYSL